jgi:hypothetical protein
MSGVCAQIVAARVVSAALTDFAYASISLRMAISSELAAAIDVFIAAPVVPSAQKRNHTRANPTIHLEFI